MPSLDAHPGQGSAKTTHADMQSSKSAENASLDFSKHPGILIQAISDTMLGCQAFVRTGLPGILKSSRPHSVLDFNEGPSSTAFKCHYF